MCLNAVFLYFWLDCRRRKRLINLMQKAGVEYYLIIQEYNNEFIIQSNTTMQQKIINYISMLDEKPRITIQLCSVFYCFFFF